MDYNVHKRKILVVNSLHSNVHFFFIPVTFLFGIPLTGLILPHFCACPKTRTGIPLAYVMVFLCSMIWGERWLFCFAYLYQWNCSPSLFKLTSPNLHMHWKLWKVLINTWRKPLSCCRSIDPLDHIMLYHVHLRACTDRIQPDLLWPL